MDRFYQGSAELDRMEAALGRAISVIAGRIAADLEQRRIPLRRDQTSHQFDPLIYSCGKEITWEINSSKTKAVGFGYKHEVKIRCMKGRIQLYPGGGIVETQQAYNSFDEFFEQLLKKNRRIERYVREMERLAPAESSLA